MNTLLEEIRSVAAVEMVPAERATRHVLGVPIDAVSMDDAVRRIARWAQRRESRVVCCSNVHSVVASSSDPVLRAALSTADLSTPDGAPVAWMMRRDSARGQQRVTGPDLMEAYCAAAARTGEAIFLFGSTEATLAALSVRLQQRWPALRIAGMLAPPFREMSVAEDREAVERINNSGAGTLWVALGCPKQERWMVEHRGRVHAVMIGVGAAFEFHAGTMSRAPRWMRDHGLEWLHRLIKEPRRLCRRYLVTNSVFIWSAAMQLLRG
jgi:N-acetylglucosaminyldiphosphoundecaprenol N-acetyl-beta-D-mannosaminyltransferase